MKLSATEKTSLYTQAALNTLGSVGVRSDPPAIIWVLTRRCFYQCTHCDSWRDETPIDLEALDIVASRIVESRAKIVALSGGEPLMIKGFPEIVARLKTAGKVVSINTNGHLLEENADWIVAEGVDHLQVSIDGHTADLHDSIRRQKGSFAKILRGVEAVAARRRSRPLVSICGTVMKANASHLVEFIERFQGVADSVELQPLHDSPGLLATSGAEPFAVHDRSRLRRELERVNQRFPSFRNSFYANFDRFLFEHESMRHFATDHCMPMIFNTLTIRDRGECFVCRYPLGEDLVNKTVREVWNSDARWALYGELVRDGCADPCWIRCNVHSSSVPGRLLKVPLRRSRGARNPEP